MDEAEKYMRRCFELAKKGTGNTAPNPLVGAVIVHQGKIIGEGYHRKYGEAHAEVNAIASVKDERLLKESIIYVSLEPCSHWGKTPPCAELIIRKQIPKVVIGSRDPFPAVSGRGIKMLQDAGIEVVCDVLEAEAKAINPAFMSAQLQNRPYVILKWAQSADGFIDRLRIDRTEAPVVFSTPQTSRLVHQLRSEVAAILTGTQTALLDNPSLTVRHWEGKSPVRLVLDRENRLPKDLHLFDGTVETLVFTAHKPAEASPVEFIELDFSGNVLAQLLAVLQQRKLNSLLVEGGAALLSAFIDAGFWDEARVEVAPVSLQQGVKAPVLPCAPESMVQAGKNSLFFYRNLRPQAL